MTSLACQADRESNVSREKIHISFTRLVAFQYPRDSARFWNFPTDGETKRLQSSPEFPCNNITSRLCGKSWLKMNEKVKDLQGTAFDPFDLNANGIEKVSDEKKMDSESFDPFNHSRGGSPDPFPDDEIDPRMEDPWSAEPESPSQNPSWLNSANVDTSFDSSQNPSWFNSTDVDISFESSLQYSASLTVGETLRSDVSNSTPDDSVRADIGEFETRDPFATDSDIFMKEAAKKEAQHTINLKLEERLSILFDGVTKVPSCRVIGSIYVSFLKLCALLTIIS